MAQTILDLEEYCDGCPMIEPRADVEVLLSGFDRIEHIGISCTNRRKCRLIHEYLKRKESEDVGE